MRKRGPTDLNRGYQPDHIDRSKIKCPCGPCNGFKPDRLIVRVLKRILRAVE